MCVIRYAYVKSTQDSKSCLKIKKSRYFMKAGKNLQVGDLDKFDVSKMSDGELVGYNDYVWQGYETTRKGSKRAIYLADEINRISTEQSNRSLKKFKSSKTKQASNKKQTNAKHVAKKKKKSNSLFMSGYRKAMKDMKKKK